MKSFYIQMIDNKVNSDCWDKLVSHFIKLGDSLEIRCWKDELEESQMAKSFDFLERDSGNPYELSFIGKVNEAVLKNLFHNKPFDKEIYNKMTRFFTLNFKNESCNLSSSHYGTEIYIEVFSNEDALFLENLMAKNQENFSFHQL